MERYVVFMLLCIGLIVGLALSAGGTDKRTVNDLKQAYLNESTAQARYSQFAIRADRDGYPSVAALFRATSYAEGVHAKNHLQALRDLRVRPIELSSGAPALGTTQQNLKNAIREETQEYTVTYPRMLADAQTEGQAEAQQTFTYALHAEEQHAALFTVALVTLSKLGPAQVFYVSPVCGGTYVGAPPAVCPVCGVPGSQFKVFESVPPYPAGWLARSRSSALAGIGQS